jgi:RNA polymerase sigma factor (sigma-70 family)
VKDDFNEFFQTHERRIYYQMQRLMIPRDLYEEFYAEGILALWNAYKSYDVEKGEIGTFINYQIRFRLIDLIRKKARHQEILELAVHEAIVQIDDGNRYSETGLPIVENCGIVLENEAFWEEVRKGLTAKQWKWVHYFIIANLSIKEIMEIEKVTADAVKS